MLELLARGFGYLLVEARDGPVEHLATPPCTALGEWVARNNVLRRLYRFGALSVPLTFSLSVLLKAV